MYLLHTSLAPRGNQLLLTRLARLNKVLSIYLSTQPIGRSPFSFHFFFYFSIYIFVNNEFGEMVPFFKKSNSGKILTIFQIFTLVS